LGRVEQGQIQGKEKAAGSNGNFFVAFLPKPSEEPQKDFKRFQGKPLPAKLPTASVQL